MRMRVLCSVLTMTDPSGVHLRTGGVSAQGLQLLAGPVSCGAVMYATRGKGFFAFSDMLGQFKVYTPTLKLLGQTTGGQPLFKERATLIKGSLSRRAEGCCGGCRCAHVHLLLSLRTPDCLFRISFLATRRCCGIAAAGPGKLTKPACCATI